MNAFGRIFRITIYGESHGEEIGVVIDGCPAGLGLDPADLAEDLERRRAGAAGTTARHEPDVPRIRSGLYNGKTTGAPLLIALANTDVRPQDYAATADVPRPGHADLTARQKFGGFNDVRGGGHFSGRLTAALVAAGAVARKILAPAAVRASVLEAGGSAEIDRAVEAAVREEDSVGGLIECRVTGLPAGLGEPFFDSVESLISHLVFSVPGIRGVEFGSGFRSAGMRGAKATTSSSTRRGPPGPTTRGESTGGLRTGMNWSSGPPSSRPRASAGPRKPST